MRRHMRRHNNMIKPRCDGTDVQAGRQAGIRHGTEHTVLHQLLHRAEPARACRENWRRLGSSTEKRRWVWQRRWVWAQKKALGQWPAGARQLIPDLISPSPHRMLSLVGTLVRQSAAMLPRSGTRGATYGRVRREIMRSIMRRTD
jgi:hypothetical protein